MIEQLINSGQSGVELAALHAAETYQIATAGTAAPGWTNDHGDAAPLLREWFALQEGPASLVARLQANIAATDAALLCCLDFTHPLTLQTLRILEAAQTPLLPIRLTNPPESGHLQAWLIAHRIRRLHVTGNRERLASPSVFSLATQILWRLCAAAGHAPQRSTDTRSRGPARAGTALSACRLTGGSEHPGDRPGNPGLKSGLLRGSDLAKADIAAQ